MHLPDGFLSLPVVAGAGALSTASVGVALRRCRATLNDRAEALLGVTAAGIFAAQMVNFPIPGGTSGHLLGGALAGILLGPWSGMLALMCVLIVQCFLFADGGLLALGANTLNMAVVGPATGYVIWSLFRPVATTLRTQAVVAGFAAWCATVLAAGLCSVELSLSGPFGLSRTLALMVGVHAVIGLGEGLITGLVVATWLRRGYEVAARVPEYRRLPGIMGCLAVSATIIVLLAPFSSQLPDGLEWTLHRLGASPPEKPSSQAWLADYEIPSLGKWGGTIVAGLVGAGAVVAAGWAATRLRAAKSLHDSAAP